MLKYMRGHLGKTLLMILVGLMAFVFVLWGIFPEVRGRGFGSGGGATDVANVGDERVSLQELQNGVNREVEMYRQFGQQIPDAMLPQLRQQVLRGLVQQKLLVAEGKRLGFLPSDEAVRSEIQKLPYFQNKDTKQFDKDTYQKVLAANHLSPGQFEDSVRSQMSEQLLIQFLQSRIRVTDAEVEREYKISSEQRELQFVRLSRENAYAKIQIAEEAVSKFLADKKNESEIQGYYAQKNSEYNKDENVCARHILYRAAKTEKAAPAAMLALHPTAANFAALAEKNSQDPSAKGKGGDLGCFPRGAMDKAFESAAFSTGIGQVSKPVQSAFGWHYILVYKKNPAVHRSLESARHEIAVELLKRARFDDVRKINQEEAESIAKSWPPKKGVEVQSTGLFNRTQSSIPKIGRADEILRAVFDENAKIQKAPQVFEMQGAFFVVKIKESRSADMSKFAEAKEKQRKDLQEQKFRALMPAWMEELTAHTKVDVNSKLLSQL